MIIFHHNEYSPCWSVNINRLFDQKKKKMKKINWRKTHQHLNSDSDKNILEMGR